MPMLRRKPTALPVEIVSDPSVLGGMPVVRGTRVPAETIAKAVASGATPLEILDHYPSLTLDAIEACIRWTDLRQR